MRETLACSIGRRRALARLAQGGGAAALWVAVPACRRPPAEPLVKPFQYGDTPQELQRLWSNILSACRSDDRSRVHELMVSLIMTQPELASLIGRQKAGELWARYQAMMSTMCNTGAVELVAHVYEKKLDDVAVTRAVGCPPAPTGAGADVAPECAAAGPALPDSEADANTTIARALVERVPFYTARIKKKSDTRGLRYDFLVYRNGFWRSGGQLAKYLAPPAPLPAAAPAPAPASPAPAAPTTR
jgi:hypothetical protein